MLESGDIRFFLSLKLIQIAHCCFIPLPPRKLDTFAKIEKSRVFFPYINKIICQFQIFNVKIDFCSISESGEFRFEKQP